MNVSIERQSNACCVAGTYNPEDRSGKKSKMQAMDELVEVVRMMCLLLTPANLHIGYTACNENAC